MSDALPTREDIARSGYEAYAQTWAASPSAEKFKALMASSWDTVSDEVRGFWLAVADALLARLRPAWERMEQELSDWRVNAHADETGHLHRCAKVNGVWSCVLGCAVRERDAARAEIDKLASTVLALDEEQIRLKADLSAVQADNERLKKELAERA